MFSFDLIMIKNILFDLGAVLIDLDLKRTFEAFQSLAGGPEKYTEINIKLAEGRFFDRYEVGDFDEEFFVMMMQQYAVMPTGRMGIVNAWNAMLLDVPTHRIDFLKELKTRNYNLFLLSNTNETHLKAINKQVREVHNLTSLDVLFDKAYYSHLLRLRKPDPACFHKVLNDSGCVASETLFIDDNLDNIATARQMGFETILHVPNSDIIDPINAKLAI